MNPEVFLHVIKTGYYFEYKWTFFSTAAHFIIAYHISLVKVPANCCKNILLILDLKQLDKIIKFYYFHTVKAVWYSQGKSKLYYTVSRVKKQLSEKRSI